MFSDFGGVGKEFGGRLQLIRARPTNKTVEAVSPTEYWDFGKCRQALPPYWLDFPNSPTFGFSVILRSLPPTEIPIALP